MASAASSLEVQEVLSEFGFNDGEIAIYRAILELGSRPASVIALKAGLKRAHTYNIIAQLMDKGIVQECVKNGVRHFTGSAPKTLFTLLENRERELEQQKQKLLRVIPLLERTQNQRLAQAKVRFFKGSDGIREIFEDMLQLPGQPIHGVMDFAGSWSTLEGNAEWVKTFIARREARDIWYYGIVNQSEASDHAITDRPSVKRELKKIQGFDLWAEISIYGSKVALISTRQELVGVIVESTPIANTLRSLYEGIWRVLPNY